jgi:hypothetical protein
MRTSAGVVRDAMLKLARADLDPGEFLYEVAARVRHIVPWDGSGWMTLDPDTLLPSGTLDTEGSPGLIRALWRNELLTPDVVPKLADFAIRATPVVASSHLEPSTVAESPRIQLIYRPAGVGDDLRVGGTSWGHLVLARELGARNFDDSEYAFIADIVPSVATGLRRSLSRRPAHAASCAPGVVAFSGTGAVISATTEAMQMIKLMPGGGASTLYPVALRTTQRDGAYARVLLTDGRWLRLHGSQMHGAPADSAQVTVTRVSS